MKFSLGQQVRFIEREGVGVIVDVLANHAYVIEDVHGFELTFTGSELICAKSGIRGTGESIVSNTAKAKIEVVTKATLPSIPFKLNNNVAELDLHMEALLKQDKLPTGVTYIDFQLGAVKELIKYCSDHKISKMIVIHGKGEGILRTELKRLLGSMKNIEFWDAQGKQHQFGAFELRLRGLYR